MTIDEALLICLNRPMLTKQDFKKIELLFEIKLDEKLEEKLNEKLGRYPTREEFFKSIDMIIGELETIRNEQILITGSQTGNEERISELEKIHSSGTHHSIVS